MTSEWSQYTTRRIQWQECADGPDAYDCMSFTRMIQAKHFGISMDRVMVGNYDDGIGLFSLLNSCGERVNWGPVKTPLHGDIVIARRPFHIGTWLDIDGGGVLHCLRGAGVVFTRDAAWGASGIGRKTYLRHRSKM